jgi:hypothetical protein
MMSKPQSKMGRPKIFDTEDKLGQLKKLMRMNPTLEDTAAYFDCGTTTVEDTIKQTWGVTFREFRDKNMVHTRLGLQRKAIEKANSGDNTMLIFALKNLCGWSDKNQVELTGKDGGAIEQTHSIERVDLIDRVQQIKGESQK